MFGSAFLSLAGLHHASEALPALVYFCVYAFANGRRFLRGQGGVVGVATQCFAQGRFVTVFHFVHLVLMLPHVFPRQGDDKCRVIGLSGLARWGPVLGARINSAEVYEWEEAGGEHNHVNLRLHRHLVFAWLRVGHVPFRRVGGSGFPALSAFLPFHVGVVLVGVVHSLVVRFERASPFHFFGV